MYKDYHYLIWAAWSTLKEEFSQKLVINIKHVINIKQLQSALDIWYTIYYQQE